MFLTSFERKTVLRNLGRKQRGGRVNETFPNTQFSH